MNTKQIGKNVVFLEKHFSNSFKNNFYTGLQYEYSKFFYNINAKNVGRKDFWKTF